MRKLTPEEVWRVTTFVELLVVLDHKINKEKRLQIRHLLAVLNWIKINLAFKCISAETVSNLTE